MFLLLCAFAIAAVAGALFASSVLFDKQPAKPEKTNLMTAKDKIIVMIMGVDEREGDVGRSDTLMIATLDPKKKKAALLSIPRDTRVKIRGHGFDKINAAYAYGGHALTQDTVEDLIGVHMEHHILINIKSFKKIIDAIGGVDINVEKRMYYEDVWDDDGGLLIDLQPGLQHMDGDTAITYVRYRDEEGDIGRIRRQQKFMQAVMDKITSPSIIPRIPSIIKEVVGSVQTDLSVKQLIEFATSLKDAQKSGLQAEMLPGKPMYIDGVSYWIPDLGRLRTTVANTLDTTLDKNLRDDLAEDTREYAESIPDNARELNAEEAREIYRHENTEDIERAKQITKRESTDEKLRKDPYEKEEPSVKQEPVVVQETEPKPKGPAPSPTVPSAGKTSN
ncbi:LCP family protein [Anaerovibrio lipolyticus]|uniref:LCP family protein n=1 Tax=Anaerovibrio lipolyticus TaxID=82374 RepID=UPI0026EDCC47|nr:LCP family protein [Anaerovibrio lipolyticus]MBE6104915.1 LytR family transcriptional regulator [Anaerovibrio lipolyticus]